MVFVVFAYKDVCKARKQREERVDVRDTGTWERTKRRVVIKYQPQGGGSIGKDLEFGDWFFYFIVFFFFAGFGCNFAKKTFWPGMAGYFCSVLM